MDIKDKNNGESRRPRQKRLEPTDQLPPSSGARRKPVETRAKEIRESPQNEYKTMSEKAFKDQSKIHQVLNAFKDDVVRIKTSEKNKWNETIQSVRSGSVMSFQNEIIQQQPHENISRDDVGNKPSVWKTNLQKNKNSKKRKNSQSSTQTGETTTKSPTTNSPYSSTYQPSISTVDSSMIESAPMLKYLVISTKTGSYCSGILAGLLITRAGFETFLMNDNNWTSAPAFITFLWSLTTFLILLTSLGFMNRVDTAKEDVRALRRFLFHFIPVLILLIFHYLNQAFHLQHRECMEFLKMSNSKRSSRSHACDGHENGQIEPLLIVLRIIPAVVALGIHTFIHLGKNKSLLQKLDSQIFST